MAQHVEGHKVFVGDLPGDVTQEEVQTVFATYGELTNLVLMNPSSKSNQRCALVFYKDASSAEDAIKVLNGVYKIREDAPTPIKVAWAKDRGGGGGAGGGGGGGDVAQDPDGFKMFIGGLPLDIKEEELKVVFSTYGEVNKLHVMQPKDGATRAAAFIYYANRQSGEDAISVLHEQYKIRPDAESPISVKWAINKDKGCGKGGQGDWNSWGGGDWGNSWGGGGGGGGAAGGKCQTVDGWKLFVGGLPQGVTEEELSVVFTTYGVVKKIHLMPPHATNTKMAAFVFYESDSSADDAIKVLNGVYKIREDMDVPIQVKWGQDKSAMKGACVGGGKGGGGGWGGGGGGGWNGGGGGGGWDGGGWGKGGGGGGGWNGGGGGGKGYGGGNYVGGGGGGGWKGGGGGGGGGYGGGYGGGGGGGWNDGGGWGKSGGKGQGKEMSDTKLFVGNLPPDVTEDAVRYVFQTYGSINNVHLMVGKSRSGAACAFVEFAQPTEAETAILTLNDKYEIKPGFGAIMVKKAGAQRKGPY